MTASARTESFEASDYLDVLRRRWLVIISMVCLGTLAAAGYLAVAHKIYTATASVYVDANAANANQLLNSRTTIAVNMDNETQIVESNSVAARAARTLNTGVTAQQLLQRVNVTVPANTTVMQISCTARSADRAAACAQAFARSYLASRQATAQSRISSATAQLNSRVTPLEAESVRLQHKISSLSSSSPQLAATHAKLAYVAAQLAPLRSAIASLGAATNYSAGYIITAAVPPASASSPKPVLYLPSGLMAGLLIGLIAAFAADRRDDRIYTARDVERFLDLPVLLRPFQQKLSSIGPVFSLRSRPGREFAKLAQAVAITLGDGDHVLLVAGASGGPITSLAAANLAVMLARTRDEVILVCAEASLSPQLLGIGTSRGLASVLAGTATVSDVVRRVAEVPRLRVVTQGGPGAAALGSPPQYEAGRRVVAELKLHARYVIIETEAVAIGVDPVNLAEFADAAVVVIETGSSLKSETEDAIRMLDVMHTPVLGAAVLPRISRSAVAKFVRAADVQQPRAAQPPPASQAKRREREAVDPQRRARPAQPQWESASRSAGRDPTGTWPLPRTTVPASEADTPADPAGGER